MSNQPELTFSSSVTSMSRAVFLRGFFAAKTIDSLATLFDMHEMVIVGMIAFADCV